jgi:hypothetical protein
MILLFGAWMAELSSGNAWRAQFWQLCCGVGERISIEGNSWHLKIPRISAEGSFNPKP